MSCDSVEHSWGEFSRNEVLLLCDRLEPGNENNKLKRVWVVIRMDTPKQGWTPCDGYTTTRKKCYFKR